MVKKRKELFFFGRIFLFLVLFQSLTGFLSALAVTPASVSIDFQPRLEQAIDYWVFLTKPDKAYSIYVKGDLAEYATLSKNKLKGDGTFKVSLSLPDSFEKPGNHILHVGVKEAVDEELNQNTIGTAVEIVALVNVYVPYPGKYAEISFSSENVNVGEPLEFNLELVNRGKEDLIVFPRIEIFSNQSKEKVETLYLENRSLVTTQRLSLHKPLDTSSYNPGRYNGVAIVDYGGASPSTAETFFRIGDLSIEIKNYTRKIILDGNIQKFNVDLESGWNDNIDGVYANVVFLNETSEVLSFQTSSTNLNPWEIKTITGYFDTLNFKEGEYNANITLSYYGRDVGKSSTKMVQVEFVKESSSILVIVLISLGGFILIILIGLIIFFSRRKKFLKEKKPSKK